MQFNLLLKMSIAFCHSLNMRPADRLIFAIRSTRLTDNYFPSLFLGTSYFVAYAACIMRSPVLRRTKCNNLASKMTCCSQDILQFVFYFKRYVLERFFNQRMKN